MEMNVSAGIAGREIRRSVKALIVAIVVIVLLLLIIYFVPLAFILTNNRTEINGDPQVMVIFGYEVDEKEGMPDILRARLDSAIDYLVEHPTVTVIVSGGNGSETKLSEADYMAAYLTQSGVRNTVILEDRSTTTAENVKYTLDLISEKALNTSSGVLLVSSDFHLARIKMIWERDGGTENVSTIAAPVDSLGDKILQHLREPFVLIGDFFSTLIPQD